MKKKITIAVVSLALAIFSVAGFTFAWLLDTTTPVKNTFTAGDVDITLIETKKPDGTEDKDGVTNWAAQMIPGEKYAKNPIVTVTNKTNVDCYLFVKFEQSEDASKYLTYESTLTESNGWTQGDGTDIPDNVWYREVKTTDDIKSWNLLKDDTITVNSESVTKETMAEAAIQSLTYTAYAVQKDNLTVTDAWKSLNTK